MPRAPIPRARRRSDHSQPRSPGQNKSTRAVQTPGGFLVPPRARRSPGGKRARPSQNLARCETRLQSSITVSTTEHYTGTFGHDGYSYDNDIPQRSGSSYPPERSCKPPTPPGGILVLTYGTRTRLEPGPFVYSQQHSSRNLAAIQHCVANNNTLPTISQSARSRPVAPPTRGSILIIVKLLPLWHCTWSCNNNLIKFAHNVSV